MQTSMSSVVQTNYRTSKDLLWGNPATFRAAQRRASLHMHTSVRRRLAAAPSVLTAMAASQRIEGPRPWIPELCLRCGGRKGCGRANGGTASKLAAPFASTPKPRAPLPGLMDR